MAFVCSLDQKNILLEGDQEEKNKNNKKKESALLSIPGA